MYFSFPDHPYIAIIGDIQDSKKIENRDKIQKLLNGILTEINQKYLNNISSKFLITLGDEFQGLLCNGENVMQIISEIKNKMFPVKIRFGIGVGDITTNINSEMSIGADGPGYYNARNAIECIKNDKKKKQTNAANIRIELDVDNQAPATMLNTILSLMTAIENTWSIRQREIIGDMLMHNGNQMDTAKRLKIKQPTVQRTLAKGNYYPYKDALDTIEKILGEIRRDDV